MKRNLTNVIIAAFIVFAPLFTLAQAPPHPNGGNAPGGGNGPVGGGAPVDGGVSILLVLGIGYGAKKVINYRKKQAE